MPQHDYALANAAGAAFRTDLNNALSAIVTRNSGATAPATTFADMIWYDTAADALKQRNSANTGWLTLITFDQTNSLLRWDFDKGADIASATTTDIGAATGNYAVVTGTTTITGLGTIKAGVWRLVRFAGVLTLTHNATSLIIPGGVNITTAAGDVMLAVSEGSGNWRIVNYQLVSGPAVSPGALINVQHLTATGTYTRTAGTVSVIVEGRGAGGGGGGADTSTVSEWAAAGGGGQGEHGKMYVAAVGATESVTINAGGTAGAATGADGGAGGTSVFGSHMTLNGGAGGIGATANRARRGGAGGTGGSGGTKRTPGAPGHSASLDKSASATYDNALGGAGGGEGGGVGTAITANSTSDAGVAGAANSGGGGSGAAAALTAGAAGGAGGLGYFIVWEYS